MRHDDVLLRRTLRGAAAAFAAMLLAGCASSGATTAPRGDRSHIYRAEMEAANVTNAYDLVQRTRPSWLRERNGRIDVYLNGSRYGTAADLARIDIGAVGRIRYLRGSEMAEEFTHMQLVGVGSVILIDSGNREDAPVVATSDEPTGTGEPSDWDLWLGLEVNARNRTAISLNDAFGADGVTSTRTDLTPPALPTVQLGRRIAGPFGLMVGGGLGGKGTTEGGRSGGATVILMQNSYEASLLGYWQYRALRVAAGPAVRSTQWEWKRGQLYLGRQAWRTTTPGLDLKLVVSNPAYGAMAFRVGVEAVFFSPAHIEASTQFSGADVRQGALRLEWGLVLRH